MDPKRNSNKIYLGFLNLKIRVLQWLVQQGHAKLCG
jgi:hypothetical protein